MHHHDGCCHSCGSKACAGACSDQRKPVVISTRNGRGHGGYCTSVDLDPLPPIQLPETLCIEVCSDCGEWFHMTLPTNLAGLMLGAGVGRQIDTDASADAVIKEVIALFQGE